MTQLQSADLRVSLNGIEIKVGATEITLSKHAARQLLQALPALIAAYDAMQKVNKRDGWIEQPEREEPQ